jgi:hypothetical protein
MATMPRIRIAAALLFVALVASACGDDDGAVASGPASTTTAATDRDPASDDPDDIAGPGDPIEADPDPAAAPADPDLRAACDRFHDQVDAVDPGDETVADWLRLLDVLPGELGEVLAVARELPTPDGTADAEWRALVDEVEQRSDEIFDLMRAALAGSDPDADGNDALEENLGPDQWGTVAAFEDSLERFDRTIGFACLEG